LVNSDKVLFDDPGESFWNDFGLLLALPDAVRARVLETLRSAPDPDDLAVMEDVLAEFPAAHRAGAKIAPSMLRWIVQRSSSSTAIGSDIVAALREVAPAERQGQIDASLDFLVASFEALRTRSDDLAVSDLRTGLIAAVRTISWEVHLAAAIGEEERVVGFLPKVVLRIQTSIARENPILIECDETALDNLIDALDEARRGLEATRQIASGTLQVGGPYKASDEATDD
jgi:hypothetical protein